MNYRLFKCPPLVHLAGSATAVTEYKKRCSALNR